MMITELYKILLRGLDLSSITYGQDVLLCGGAFLCTMIDCFIILIILCILVKLITKKGIRYWLSKII